MPGKFRGHQRFQAGWIKLLGLDLVDEAREFASELQRLCRANLRLARGATPGGDQAGETELACQPWHRRRQIGERGV